MQSWEALCFKPIGNGQRLLQHTLPVVTRSCSLVKWAGVALVQLSLGDSNDVGAIPMFRSATCAAVVSLAVWR